MRSGSGAVGEEVRLGGGGAECVCVCVGVGVTCGLVACLRVCQFDVWPVDAALGDAAARVLGGDGDAWVRAPGIAAWDEGEACGRAVPCRNAPTPPELRCA
ncbi:hypothetical protein CHLRE_07g325747v5 [Chlamydomonas reinhardtii]|uniref:Uncharacterized protein n=1 Tax=Chlamydomonas reinhardtii TaxID=3055 RepID=A0A2K3DJG1_CHLRE|nr:uncharacterized protein CHLRE_07g325747v5 [Chlamydomonas reinhardtii]PNW80673.1 hypothetical protein CHLRE_07g325747v5 [Chlamydomonas reinhardtii]